MMLADPSKKYRRMYQRVDLPDRQWPNNEINQAPIWMSTDLRDGNQAIFEPMNMDQKLKMFKIELHFHPEQLNSVKHLKEIR